MVVKNGIEYLGVWGDEKNGFYFLSGTNIPDWVGTGEISYDVDDDDRVVVYEGCVYEAGHYTPRN